MSQIGFALARLGAIFALAIGFSKQNQTLAQFEIGFAPPESEFAISISADQGATWKKGVYDVWHLEGRVTITQGQFVAKAQRAVIWHEPSRENSAHRLLVYLEQSVSVDIDRKTNTSQNANAEFTGNSWDGRLISSGGVLWNVLPTSGLKNTQEIADRARAVFFPVTARAAGHNESDRPIASLAQQTAQDRSAPGPLLISPHDGSSQQIIDPTTTFQIARPQSGRANNRPLPPTDVEITPKHTGVDLNIQFIQSPNPNERIGVAIGGVRIAVTGAQLANLPQFGNQRTDKALIVADNVVVWQSAVEQLDVNGNPISINHWEMYLEGNIKFAMGERVVFAERMYYDANLKRGTILSAEVLTPVPRYQGLVRLKADVVQQLNENFSQAYGASITSSRIGVPRYWLQSNQIDIRREPNSAPLNFNRRFDPFDQPLQTEYTNTAEAQGNAVYLLGMPVFYWPRIKTNLDNPSYYLERIRVGSDNVFGTQVFTAWDVYQLLGIQQPPDGTEWLVNFDYLSERGFGVGSEFNYQRDSIWGIPGPANGNYQSWFIKDRGLDNLGRGRQATPLEEEYRGHARLRHHQQFDQNTSIRAELGYISDRNFLEQYFEREWDNGKDYTTGAIFTRNFANQSFTVNADVQINDFFTQTEWLPRADHFIFGQPLPFGRGVFHGHSHVGYGRFRPGEAPTNPVDLLKFDPLAWEVAQSEGVRAGTRQEIDFPVQLGNFKVVPYVLGDVTYWQEDINQNDLFRAYGQTGIKFSLPMWRVDPTIQSCLYNLNGLAHKVTFDTEFLYADASQNLADLPLYDNLDDDAQEAFRRRFAFDTFGIAPGGDAPLSFDERFFAYRYNMQGRVSSNANEIADDLMVMRTGIRNRWQTKRGLPGEQRIIDWMTLDVEAAYFPDADRDNFGEEFGMLDYDYSWHIGDRLSIVSDGYFDFFDNGLKTASIGIHASRPAVGNVYLGFRTIEGPISSNVLKGSVTYQMSDKWIIQAGSSVDFGAAGTIGQQLSFIHVGESFLLRAGLHADASRGNVGFLFGIEPRFISKPQLARVGGRRIPPAGVRWFE